VPVPHLGFRAAGGVCGESLSLSRTRAAAPVNEEPALLSRERARPACEPRRRRVLQARWRPRPPRAGRERRGEPSAHAGDVCATSSDLSKHNSRRAHLIWCVCMYVQAPSRARDGDAGVKRDSLLGVKRDFSSRPIRPRTRSIPRALMLEFADGEDRPLRAIAAGEIDLPARDRCWPRAIDADGQPVRRQTPLSLCHASRR
jgi:hypothetical protein